MVITCMAFLILILMIFVCGVDAVNVVSVRKIFDRDLLV